jgi:hypothetical protein
MRFTRREAKPAAALPQVFRHRELQYAIIVKRGVGRIRFAAYLVTLLASFGLLVGAAGATSCPYLIEWNGVRYDAGSLNRQVGFGDRIGEASEIACGDEAAGCSSDDVGPVPVFRLAGVDPHVAVGARAPWGPEVFLAAGYFPQLPDHPLHAAAYGSSRHPNERAGWQCGAAIPDLAGTVVNETPGSGWIFQVRFEGDRVQRDNGRTALFVDAQTTITGFDEFGLPRIIEGDHLRATVRECTASGDRYKVVADAISNEDL